MKPEMKKLIIANLPYLLFVYLFSKLGQTYRLAAGADLSEKLLHLADGFSLAFESAAPSFHLFDLAVGVAGAVALRLMVYCKSKNAKKYRRGVEYGSARWFAISTAQKMMWLCRWPLSISGKKTIKNKRLFRGLHKKQNRGCFIHPPFSRRFHSI